MKNGRQIPGLREIGLALMLSCLLLGLSGCQLPGIMRPAAKEPPVLIPVEIYFTGNSEPLVGYMWDLDISKSGYLLQGGSSVNYVYDQEGREIAVFNYARAEYIKILPQ